MVGTLIISGKKWELELSQEIACMKNRRSTGQ